MHCVRGAWSFVESPTGVHTGTRGALTRADARAVWRYMPHAVNADARAWLQHGITGGTASDAKLVLRGNLRDFPFRDPKQGQFLVTAKAHDARIDYAEGWPVIEHIEADMEFDYGMRIKAQRGRILGHPRCRQRAHRPGH